MESLVFDNVTGPAGNVPSKERSSACRKAFYCMPMRQTPQDSTGFASQWPPGAAVAAPGSACPPMTSPAEAAAPLVVLDTNVVLDWLLFRNPGCAALDAALTAGAVRWIATAAMRDELAHVLGRGRLDPWQPDLPALWTAWDRHCSLVATPLATATPGRPRCSDPDDQKFIDLAVTAPARWLVSRDRAVLKLARRLRELGVHVTPPGQWSALAQASG